MNWSGKNELEIRRYLLDEMGEQERDVIERRLLTDDDYYEEIKAAEENLIDEYAAGELSIVQRKQFEERFMTAREQREKVTFAIALNRSISQRRRSRSQDSAPRESKVAEWSGRYSARGWRGWVAPALICATLLLAAAATWLIVETSRLRRQIEAIQSARNKAGQVEEELQRRLSEEQARGEALSRQIANDEMALARMDEELTRLRRRQTASAADTGSDVFSIVLAPGLSRGSDKAASITLPDDARRLRVDLRLPDSDYRSFKVEVKTAEGEEILVQGSLRARQRGAKKVVEFTLPAELLTATDYTVALSGKHSKTNYEAIRTYFFKIVRP